MADQQQAPPIPQGPPRQPPPDRPHLTTKLIIIACLGGLALLLGCFCFVVRLQISKTQQLLLQKANIQAGSHQDHAGAKTTRISDPTNPRDLYLWQQPQTLPNTGSSRLTAATAYWNQFLGISPAEADSAWNPLMELNMNFRPHHRDYDLMSNRTLAEHKYYCLQQAARLGHPQAQHVYANALASGVLPLYSQSSSHLEVADDFFHTHHPQQQEAWLTWHMAAMSGHVESAMALAHRYETQRQRNENTQKSNSINKRRATKQSSQVDHSFQCGDVLPYYQAAAHGIMDQLESDRNSRAKVLPPTEKHLLHAVHLHGGTSSQLDWHNKPDESMEAIQFYHFKAARSVDPDVGAAMTLATLYHHGYRGVEQNLTMALFYYDIAANEGSWEAAGMAGWFHVFGMGMEPQQRDLFKAQKYFRQGIIGGLNGCKERFNKKKRIKTQQENVIQCEASCLNGMGLLHVFGVPLVADVDLEEAIAYFTLANDMGHADAAYNLAMVTLGWKGSYMTKEDANKYKEDYDMLKARKEAKDKESGVEKDPADDIPGFMQYPWSMQDGPSKVELQHVSQYLMSAAKKGHLQARHRLAMLYDTGLLSTSIKDKQSSSSRKGKGKTDRTNEILPQDCDKALLHYKVIVEAASPHIMLRLRSAYKDYMAGHSEDSLIQYMSVAELGNEIAQVNAAFLLEQGVCLGLTSTECHKASARYWKAAAATGNAEACLRVGDFYYYGKLRPPQEPLSVVWDRPFGIFQYLIFPEKYWLPALSSVLQSLIQEIVHGVVVFLDPTGSSLGSSSEDKSDIRSKEGSCDAAEGTCAADTTAEEDATDNALHRTTTRKEEDEHDLSMAAHYYRIAAEKHESPRAHFNLGFLHEWGHGLKQDFPLAKRHYDLAASSHSKEADLASQISLWALSLHEYFVRLSVAWAEYWDHKAAEAGVPGTDGSGSSNVPKVVGNMLGSKPALGPTSVGSPYSSDHRRKTKTDVLIAHLLSVESLLILILTIILWMMLRKLRQRTRR